MTPLASLRRRLRALLSLPDRVAAAVEVARLTAERDEALAVCRVLEDTAPPAHGRERCREAAAVIAALVPPARLDEPCEPAPA
jgi:hypothetical protein